MPANQCMPAAWRRRIGNYVNHLQLALCALLLAACGSVPQAPVEQGAKTPPVSASSAPALPPAGSGRGGYYMDDGPGDRTPEGLLATPDAEPKVEPYSKSGNRQYVVFGKTYTPILDERPYKQRGRGSWYGKKFHGKRTSSGEPYDMYKMTAAHPTLPLPSYARVTNLANGRQVIVRVNDRGPFLSSRIIDLSYTAALKLGYLQQGSAELEVERLLPEEIEQMAANRASSGGQAEPSAVAGNARAAAPMMTAATQPAQQEAGSGVSVFAVPVAAAASTTATASATAATPVAASAPAGGVYLQLGAYTRAEGAEAARNRLREQWQGALPPIEIIAADAVYRLFSGPFASRDEAAATAQKLKDGGAASPMVVLR